MSDSVYLLL